MIKEITFEEIKQCWNKLWSKYININDDFGSMYTPSGRTLHEEYIIKRINTTTQKNYFYRVISMLNLDQKQLEKMITPIYIGYFVDGKVVAVESGYKTNIDYYRVRGLWVNEKYRRSGVATKLVSWFESRCKEKYLWTLPRHGALEFYLNYGFKVTGLSEKTLYGQNYFAVKEIRN
jgi:GNAT superfamily N-acetyltransferase